MLANRVRNQLLAALPAAEYSRLQPLLKPAPFTFKKILHRRGDRIETVIFPSSGVGSMVNVMADGRIVEVATIGNEGFIGDTVALGGDIALSEVIVQVPGADALSMSAAAFRAEFDRRGPLHTVISGYLQALQSQIMQSAACNILHSVEERCARWLLMTHDRVHGDELHLTHEFLGTMLGARRPTVSLVLGTLAKAGLVQIGTKRITVVNRKGLEDASCECYEAVRTTFARLVPAEKSRTGLTENRQVVTNRTASLR